MPIIRPMYVLYISNKPTCKLAWIIDHELLLILSGAASRARCHSWSICSPSISPSTVVRTWIPTLSLSLGLGGTTEISDEIESYRPIWSEWPVSACVCATRKCMPRHLLLVTDADGHVVFDVHARHTYGHRSLTWPGLEQAYGHRSLDLERAQSQARLYHCF